MKKTQGTRNAIHSPPARAIGFESLEERIVLTATVFETDLVEPDLGWNAANFYAAEAHPAQSSPAEVTAQSTDQQQLDGNTYRSARNLGMIAGTIKINDFVGRGDRKDIYKFRLADEMNVRIKLSGMTADAELRLLDSNRDLIRWSLKSGTHNEFIKTDLDRGWYFVRVDAFDGRNSTDYDLRITTVDSRPDTGGDSLTAATDLGVLDQNNDIRMSGWVGTGDRWDYYKFQAEQFLNIRSVLSRLSANANLYFYNSDHQLLDSSTERGRNVDRISGDISPGVYIFGIRANSSGVNYQLSVSAEPKDLHGRLENVDYYGRPARDAALNAIYAPEAWNAGYTGDSVVVAVIDSGVDHQHRDLQSRIWINEDEIYGDGIDNDNNGFVDDVRGWDFSENDNNPNDLNGHGTHVAGVIAGARNHLGVTGIAHDAEIMAIRVLDKDGDGSFGELARGIYYAVDNGADVINLSIGGEYNYAVRAAIAYANSHGVFVAVATGNGGHEMPFYPARHSASLSNTISVGAHNIQDVRAWFSNYVGSSNAIQVDAPGVNIYSTLPGNRFGRYSGTSSAAPYVSGLAALVLSVDANYSPNLVRHFIAEGAIRDIAGSDSIGGIDAARTLYLAREYSGNPAGGNLGSNDDGSGSGSGSRGGPGIQKQDFLDWNRIASVSPSTATTLNPVVVEFREVALSDRDVEASALLSQTKLRFLPTAETTTSSSVIDSTFADSDSTSDLFEDVDREWAESLVESDATRMNDLLDWINQMKVPSLVG